MENFIASNLRILLAVTNTKQYVLAEAIGVSGRNTISSWIQETSTPSAKKVQLICKYFGVSVDRFMNVDFGKTVKKEFQQPRKEALAA
jgi:transcriptional regulator with XRE-family HTH domain